MPGPNLPAPIQQDLPGVRVEIVERREQDGNYTLERVKVRRPEGYRLARRHLEAGLSLDAVADLCEMSKHTVMAIAEEVGKEHGLTGDEVGRLVFQRESRRASVLAAAKVAEMLSKGGEGVDLKSAAVALKYTTEAAELVAGLPTARVEMTGVKVEDALAELERCKGGK
jgi:hypothetical protein